MTKATGPQNTNTLSKSLILDIFKQIGWFTDSFSIVLFLAMIDTWTRSYFCKAHRVKNIFRFSLSAFFF